MVEKVKQFVYLERTPLDPEMEIKLLEYLLDAQNKKIPITRKIIINVAFMYSNRRSFAASDNWFKRFLKRSDIVILKKSDSNSQNLYII